MTQSKQSNSRAEKVRTRRKTSGRSHARKRRSGRGRTVRQLPPVMVRGGDAPAAPQRKSKRKRAKRRFDVALAAPGVEISLPSVPSIKIGWRLMSFALVLGLSVLLYYLWTSPSFQIEKAEVQGAVRLSPQNINNALLIYNKHVFEIRPDELEQQLRNVYPGLTAVSVQVGFPSKVVVKVEERVPVLAWEQDSRVWWVDVRGIAFPPRGEAESLVRVVASSSPLVIIHPENESTQDVDDESPQVFISSEIVALILSLNVYAPNGTTIVYDPQYGFGWRNPAGWDVYFGVDDADISMKFSVYETVLERLRKDGIQPALISVEHLNAPYYRLEQ